MSLTTRAITAFAVLAAAAIPSGALTVKNTSSNEISVGVDNGTTEGVYKIPAGGSVDVKEDCSADCAVTGPWGYSRLVSQNATIETDGLPLVTAGAAPPSPPAPAAAPSQSLVPQNATVEPGTATGEEPAETPKPTAAEKPAAAPVEAPKAEAAAAAPAAEKAPAATPQPAKPRRRVAKPRKPTKQVQKGPGAGSLQMLFQGPGK